MASDLDSFEKIFCGVWEWDRDDNFAEGLKKMTYPDEAINMLVNAKPSIEIERRGDAIYMKFIFGSGPGMTHDCLFKLGEEFEAKDNTNETPMFHTKEVATFKDGVLTFKAKTQITGPGKVDNQSDFFVKDGELHTPMSPLGDTSFNANRIYKPAK